MPDTLAPRITRFAALFFRPAARDP